MILRQGSQQKNISKRQLREYKKTGVKAPASSIINKPMKIANTAILIMCCNTGNSLKSAND
jgi:hypothetical protein